LSPGSADFFGRPHYVRSRPLRPRLDRTGAKDSGILPFFLAFLSQSPPTLAPVILYLLRKGERDNTDQERRRLIAQRIPVAFERSRLGFVGLIHPYFNIGETEGSTCPHPLLLVPSLRRPIPKRPFSRVVKEDKKRLTVSVMVRRSCHLLTSLSTSVQTFR